MTVVVLGGWAIPSGAADEPKIVLSQLRVVDPTGGDPYPFSAGVAACPVDHAPCGLTSPYLLHATADADGYVRLTVNPNVQYIFRGFHFCSGGPEVSDPVVAYGREMARPVTFVVPQSPLCIGVWVRGQPIHGPSFPFVNGQPGGVQACPVGGGACVGIGVADDTGLVAFGPGFAPLDPAVTYTFTAIFGDVEGWTCGLVFEGHQLFFSEPFVGTPGQADGRTFIIYQPDPSSCTA